jgi:hypothetical protein
LSGGCVDRVRGRSVVARHIGDMPVIPGSFQSFPDAVLRELEGFYNEHRPHRTLQAAAPLRALPDPIADPERIARLDVRRRDRLGGTLHEYQHAA